MAAAGDTGPLGSNGKRSALVNTVVGVLLAAAVGVSGFALQRGLTLSDRVIVLEQHNVRAAELGERVKLLEDGRAQQREGLVRVEERLKGIDEKLAAIQASLERRGR